jgi:hypothetical protein
MFGSCSEASRHAGVREFHQLLSEPRQEPPLWSINPRVNAAVGRKLSGADSLVYSVYGLHPPTLTVLGCSPRPQSQHGIFHVNPS